MKNASKRLILLVITIIAVAVTGLYVLICLDRATKVDQFNCQKCLGRDAIAGYVALGQAGVGDAYVLVAENIMVTGRTDLGSEALWWDKAIMAGSTRQNVAYAHTLMKEASLRPVSSISRRLLFEEAKGKLQIALRNAFRMVTVDDSSLVERRRDIDLIERDIKEIDGELR